MNTKSTLAGFHKIKLALLVAAMTLTAVITGSSLNSNAGFLTHKGKFYSDFATYADAKTAAADLNLKLSQEGDVLVKNNGVLPLAGNEKISVFGVREDGLVGGTGSISGSLRDAGFTVNSALTGFYAGDNSAIGSEIYDFSQSIKDSLTLNGDAAVILFSRTGGEGSDLKTVTSETEDNKDGKGVDYSWKHKALFTDAGQVTYKHYLMLTESEEKLIAFVKDHFKKIIVVVNTSNALEMGNLQNDPAINAILWIGRPGATGVKAVGQILKGQINPSGRLVDEWTGDFTADPTWYNFGNNAQTGTFNTYNYFDGKPSGSTGSSMGGSSGFHGIDYEEDIYLGYKYYETYYYEMYKANPAAAQKWWQNNVVYPFGSGLSYTTFSFDMLGIYTDAAGKKALGATVSGADFASVTGSPARVKSLYVPVRVTNTGRVEGKEVVEIYVTTPYTSGKIEKPFVTLAGYGKTKSLKPGENQTITVSINVQDMASYDYTDANANGNKGYELDPGDYIIRAMSTSHVDLAAAPSKNDDYDDRKFTIKSAKAINIKLDDFSGNEIKNLFSKENGAFYSLRTGLNVDSNANEILMSRANFDGTFPRQYSTADLTLTKDFTDAIAYLDGFDADDQAKYADKTTDPWYVPAATVPATWTQAAAAAKGNTTILSQMSGINPFDRSAGQVAWQNFMNQLSWNELTSIVNAGGHQTVAVPSIAKAKSSDENGPNGLSNSHAFCDETVIASTWNVELAEAEGKMIGNFGMFLGISGWYGPGMNTHRSPFGGRCNEYYSQDGIQGGYIASAVVGGAQSKGLNCYIKHFLINDQETNRNGECLFTWLSEQAFRENYLKVFQMAMQEGGATASMTAFARIGRIPTADHYNLLTKLVREEWGWHGYFVTDAYGGCRASCPMDLIIRAGNDLPDGTATGAGVVSGAWNPALRGGKGDVEVGTTTKSENYLQYYYVRMCAMRVLYLACNSQNNLNGINFAGYTGGTIGSVTQSVPLTPMSVAVSAPNLHGSTATYAVTSGTLPAGLTLSSTGAITGIPTADAGAYAFVVTCTADGWIKKTANYAVTVNAK